MSADGWIIAGIGVALMMGCCLPFVARQRRLERHAAEARIEAKRRGLHEPVSLHPVIAAHTCIGTGNCIAACPEGDVLGLVSGLATPISPALCIGHGLCERVCPVEAIQLVFGTERRGIEIPRIKQNFETNVPGLYVIGELGGMGLIGNAFEQGRQCIAGIRRERSPNGGGSSDVLDVLIVGCGPAGLSASLECLQHGLNFATIERGDIGGTVRSYPRKKLVLTRPVRVPGYGKLPFHEIRKEGLMEVWEDILRKTGLEVQTGETVTGVRRGDEGIFRIRTSERELEARRVILAIGRRGVPRKLGVPGEDLPKVAYSLREPEEYGEDQVLVVGGGDAAVEAALALAEQPGADVNVSYRREQFTRIKPSNAQRIAHAIDDGRISVLWSTHVDRIEPDSVVYHTGHEETRVIPNDQVFVFAGGELPTRFLKECGVEIDTKFGRT